MVQNPEKTKTIDIFIKSLNRAYYLDRCLSSIKKNISGNYNITVLDDGTPEKYLKKIQEKFSDIILSTSPRYDEKIRLTEKGKEVDGFHIPAKFWKASVEEGSEYFIMLEDDVWFTKMLNLDEIVLECKKNDIQLLKLGWLGNHREDKFLETEPLSPLIEKTIPKNIFLPPKKIIEYIFYNRYKLSSILYRLKQIDNETQNRYWALNSISMGLYRKEYWLKIWEGIENTVDEKRQLVNAAAFYRKHKNNSCFVCRLTQEYLKTTFQSSATNSYHMYETRFDVNVFNHTLNEAWFKGKLEAMENYPKDFSSHYMESFLNEKTEATEWKKWREIFKKQYADLGCEVN
ncbi:MAG: glycosyltransferase [Bergeyella sp.]|nr:glycosyltransferase [Bergeyella sp.]